MSPSSFHLKVRQFEHRCWFELTWGQGQQLEAEVDFPASLPERYENWRRLYRKFYENYLPSEPPPSPTPSAAAPLRGRVVDSGSLPPVETDWYGWLGEAEHSLLNEFQRWLRQEELYALRAAIAQATRETRQPVRVFLSCSTDLARLPWEAWEIGSDFAATGSIRIVRTPPNIPRGNHSRRRRGRARILAILGDDTGLDFETDRQAVKALARVAEVQFVGWQPGKSVLQVREEIVQAIAQEDGWDLLFFAGHSNEKASRGGEMSIAPNASLSIADLAPVLQGAQQRGLQFALFNSCSGLDIAESLIALGFSQVAVMREPIHNRVAQEFLVRFLQRLGEFHDVQESLVFACQALRTEKNFACPSAYLVPSLFCHPGATLFQIPPSGWRSRLQSVLPNRWEAIALTVCLLAGVLAPTQQMLLDNRLWMQAAYRDLTGQLPPAEQVPPVALVQIDQRSIKDAELQQINPMDQRYLGQLLERLMARDARVIGIDYLLDIAQPEQGPALRQTLERGVQQGTWFVLQTDAKPTGEIGPSPDLADPRWSLQGFTNADHGYIMLRYPDEDCRAYCPFSYLLSLVQSSRSLPAAPRPALTSPTDLRRQLVDYLDRKTAESPESLQAQRLRSLHFAPLSTQIYLGLHNFPQLHSFWFKPILDYSLPPNRIYDRIYAWGLEDPQSIPADRLPHQVVILAAGLYDQAGMYPGQGDAMPMPPALTYWRDRLYRPAQPRPAFNDPSYWSRELTGGEHLAYELHHLLTGRLVVPVPDLLVILPTVLLGVSLRSWLLYRQRQGQWNRRQRRLVTLGSLSSTVLYSLTSLQLYITAGVLLPIFLPSVVFWSYLVTALRRKA